MPIKVSLHHQTEYRYSKLVSLGPQVVRLRPAPHTRTPIASYSLKIEPEKHFINWQQDPHGNYLARLVFPEKTDLFRVTVSVVADMTVVNPFDFFLEDDATEFPFHYADDLAEELKPFLGKPDESPAIREYLKTIDVTPRRTIFFLVDLNARLQNDISYLIRLEPGVQTPDETLQKRSGSCRDSAWLLVHLLRHFGLAARFVSGYLIQLTADQKPLEGPEGPSVDFTDLHAWTEVYLPGAGWIGLDPTSGLLTGEGHIPLAATPAPQSAAPISGCVEKSEVEFDFQMSVTRIHEDPRVTKPCSDETWERIDQVGRDVDARLKADDVRLTMGGEPTFVSIDDMDGPEWNTAAVGPKKQQLSDALIRRLADRFASGALLHYGQGKWYPGESLPRWAYSCIWRKDGQPIWNRPDLLADVSLFNGLKNGGTSKSSDLKLPEHPATEVTAGEFLSELADRLQVDGSCIRPAYEDVYHVLDTEQKLPPDVDPRQYDLDASEDRRRLSRALERGLSRPVGFILPLTRAWWQSNARWVSGQWPFRSQRLFLIPGDSPIGLRLPLDSLPVRGADRAPLYTIDPFAERHPLPGYVEIRRTARQRVSSDSADVSISRQTRRSSQMPGDDAMGEDAELGDTKSGEATGGPDRAGTSFNGVIRTAMCVEPRNGVIHVFMPPTGCLEDYLDLIACIEDTAEHLQQQVIIEGYMPPQDPRIEILKVTPDPGVIEVNVQPAVSWEHLKEITEGV
ncbi:MAG: transglutaminase family protein, partial [Planctomyces sp.]